MAGRTIWSGSLSFGLVNLPIRMHSAISEKKVRFHQLSGKTGARIRQKRVDSSIDEEVAYEDIVKGYEISPDRYVTILPEELEGLAPQKTKRIDLENFVVQDQISPTLYDTSYYLAPDAGAEKSYRLLVAAMEQSGRIGIGRVVIREKEKVLAVRAEGGVLLISMLAWPDEVNQPPEIGPADVSDREVQMGVQLIESMAVDFDHSKYKDTHRERILDLIERKAAGEEITAPEEAEEAAPAPDLMAALEASLEAQAKPKAKPKAKKKAAV